MIMAVEEQPEPPAVTWCFLSYKISWAWSAAAAVETGSLHHGFWSSKSWTHMCLGALFSLSKASTETPRGANIHAALFLKSSFHLCTWCHATSTRLLCCGVGKRKNHIKQENHFYSQGLFCAVGEGKKVNNKNNTSFLHNKTITDSAEFRAITLKKANKLYNTAKEGKKHLQRLNGLMDG